ncbi:MAG TPA: DUF177 domain-containing protein [Sphingomicrobium sp.]|nr:DUF177 domain-containing protein [Sphingomicrobium sp.]
MTDNFAHHLRLDRIHAGDRVDLIADEAERQAIAERFGLQSLGRLEAHATLNRTGDAVHAEGRIVASLDRNCVITGDPVPAHVDEAFEIAFLPEPTVARSEEEIELDPADCDVVFHDGSTIDLGGAIADTLALGLPAYPRSPGAEAALKEAGILSEAEASPFAALAQLMKGSGDS